MIGEPFEVGMSAVVEASVTHHAPCVPECPVCYPGRGGTVKEFVDRLKADGGSLRVGGTVVNVETTEESED